MLKIGIFILSVVMFIGCSGGNQSDNGLKVHSIIPNYSGEYLKKPGLVDTVPTSVEKGTLFAAPDGMGSGMSMDDTTSIDIALSKLKPGSILFLKGGVYKGWKRLLISDLKGSAQNPVIIESYPGETAILDGEHRSNIAGFEIWGDSEYVQLRNLEIRNMMRNGVQVQGSHNKVEGCNIHHNVGGGIHILSSAGYDKDTKRYPDGAHVIFANNIHDNSDAEFYGNGYKNGGNSDGISISSGQGSKILHNIVYANSDDGIDTWQSNNAEVAYNVVFENGIAGGEGNGIKLGGYLKADKEIGVGAYAHHNISFLNKSYGFTLNAGRDVRVYNNTTFNNTMGYANFNMKFKPEVKNNISYKDKEAPIGNFKGIMENNSWQRIGTLTVQSENPNSPNFLIPISQSTFSKLGAYN